MLDKYIHFILVYFEHSGDDEPYGSLNIEVSELDSPGSRYVPLMSFCEYGNEPSNFIQCGEYLHYLGSYSLGKEDSAPCI